MAGHSDGDGGEYRPREHDHLVEPMIAALDEHSSAVERRRSARGCALWIAALLAPLQSAALVLTAGHAPAQSVSAGQGGGPAGWAASLRVPQPTGVRAVHSSGQTFVTWLERPELHGESYRIYRAPFPFHDVRVSGVVDLGQRTWEGSGEFYADRVSDPDACEHGVMDCGRPQTPLPCFRPRYVERHWIPDGQGGAREVPGGEGLLVWTLDCPDFLAGCEQPSGTYWYAVTTVDRSGIENPWVGHDNRAGVFEAQGEPLPVEVPRQFLDCSQPEYCPYENQGLENPLPSGVHVLIQYMDLRRFNATFAAPNATNCWWGEDPDAPEVENARAYAFTYIVAEPDPLLAGCAGPYPLVIDLHGHGGGAKGPLYGPGGVYAYAPGCALEIQPCDVGDTWWYGFSATFDYRTAQAGCPQEVCAELDTEFPPLPPYARIPDSGPVVNFTEARVLRMVYDLLRAPLPGYPVDPERVYVSGSSMGATGALALALRYPNVIAAAAVGKPLTDARTYLVGVPPEPESDLRHELPMRFGVYPELALPSGLPLLTTINVGPGTWADHLAAFDGTPVYDWLDHLGQMQSPAWRALDSAPFGIKAGFADVVLPYPTQGAPFFAVSGIGDLGRCWGGVIGCEGHGGSAQAGMPPALSASASNPAPDPFSDYGIVRGESVPGFSELSAGLYPPPPLVCCVAPCVPEGPFAYYHDLLWSSSWYDWDTEFGPPVDQPQLWEISLKWTGPFTPPPTVTITPRRLQHFQVDPGAFYRWRNVELGTGQVIQPLSPPFKPLPSGVIEVRGVQLTPPGNRLVLIRVP